jgi:aminoethylphosphonate catabolism LysR family transcriptional regulator
MYQRWLEAFHFVGRLGSFTAAAEKLGVGQPTISSHVKSLEDYFRVELFYRDGRNIRLTALGKALLDITHGLHGHEEEAVALLRAARSHDVGSLTIAALRPTEALEILKEFHAGHPNVMLRVMLTASPTVLDHLLRFECDAGVVGYQPNDPRYFSLPFGRHRIMLVINRKDRLARRSSVQLTDLQNRDMIVRAKGSTTRVAFEAALAKKSVSVRQVLETDSREAVLRAVAHGMGIGVITESELVPMEGIKAIAIEDAPMFTYAHIVCLAERKNRPLISAFLDIAKRQAKALNPELKRPAAMKPARPKVTVPS